MLSRKEKFYFNQNLIASAELFQQVLSDLQLCDLMASGQQFTWMNKREEDSFVMERLDRAFASTEWINHYHLYYLRNLPINRSDYGPIILDFEHQTPFRNRPFRFEQMWITHPSYRDMVSKAWEWQSSGSRAAKLRNKLNNIKLLLETGINKCLVK